jgi:hypothetical protein
VPSRSSAIKRIAIFGGKTLAPARRAVQQTHST